VKAASQYVSLSPSPWFRIAWLNCTSQIYKSFINEGYSPYTWRNHPLHLQPPHFFSLHDPRTKACLDWIFLISSLNFSFWSEKEGTIEEGQRYGVDWREGWGDRRKKVWTGYWSLVAAINKGQFTAFILSIAETALPALEAKIPITDPSFYYSKTSCPDTVLESVFRPASQCSEPMPLLAQRISVMREVGAVLVSVSIVYVNMVDFHDWARLHSEIWGILCRPSRPLQCEALQSGDCFAAGPNDCKRISVIP
jgi:Queuosine salvage protein